MCGCQCFQRARRASDRAPGRISNQPAARRPTGALRGLLFTQITITTLLALAMTGAAAGAGTALSGSGQPAGTAAAQLPHKTQQRGRWHLAQQRQHAAALSTAVHSKHVLDHQQQQQQQSLSPTGTSAPHAADHDASPPAPTGSSGGSRLARRRLQQFPLPLTDLYSGGVTPGFFNLDQNPVTGTHADAGGVSVDVSADKNYMGLGVGNLFGIGIARNRGWNVQVGGGNVLDVSVTKDAGIGLWVLDGLININILPDGTWGLGTMAVRGTISEAVAAASTPVTSVVVDDTTATIASSQPPASSTGSSGPSVGTSYSPAPAAAAAAAPAIIVPLPVPVTVADPTAVEAPAAQYTDYQDSSWVDVAPAPAAPWPTSSSGSGSRVSASPAPAEPSSYLVSRPAAAASTGDGSDASSEHDALWSVASSYSDTQAASASRLAAGGGSSSASARQPCQGGTVLWVSGSKYKCKYKRAALVRVASGLTTYSSGIVTR